jgi:ABC-type phosphate transport system substrate-binding protein
MLSFGRRKSARAGIRAALLAGATVAAVGLGATGSASATPPNCTGGATIQGEGSSLQVAAQNVWVPAFGAEPGCSGLVSSYIKSSSGTGMAKWNHNGVSGTIDHTRQYIGTDDGPNATQIGNINTAASSAGVLTVPVAQTSIAIIADPPAGCELGGPGEPGVITNKDLENVFNGTLLKWSQLSTVLANPNPACNHKIERVVRTDASGTTYQLKNYLSLIRGANVKVPCTASPGKTWGELEENGVGGHPNLDWPEDEGCAVTDSPLIRPVATGGGAVAEEVIAKPGTIGYAALPDAKGKLASCVVCHEGQILEVQKNGKKKLSEAVFSNAEVVGGEQEANCLSTKYTVPTLARRSTVATHGINSDWSKVFGAKIDTTTPGSGNGYPLCTLTYDLAFNHYETAGFPEAEKVAQTVKAYLDEYVVQTAGQSAMGEGHYYAELPHPLASANNVLDAAQFAAGKIGK